MWCSTRGNSSSWKNGLSLLANIEDGILELLLNLGHRRHSSHVGWFTSRKTFTARHWSVFAMPRIEVRRLKGCLQPPNLITGVRVLPSSSGTWWLTWGRWPLPPCCHCGWEEQGTCRPCSVRGPKDGGSAWSKTRRPGRHRTSWQAS